MGEQVRTPLFMIRSMGDGRQEKLHAQTREVIDVYGLVGGKAIGHNRKQTAERTLIVPGDPDQVETVSRILLGCF